MVLVAGLCGNAASLLLPSHPSADACSEVCALPASLDTQCLRCASRTFCNMVCRAANERAAVEMVLGERSMRHALSCTQSICRC